MSWPELHPTPSLPHSTTALHTAESLQSRHDEVGEALREVNAQLKVFGTEGRKGQLDAAATEREHAEAEYLRVHRRARAAQLLRSVMARHRDATRLRYVDPFRNQVERLGRIVFGDTFRSRDRQRTTDLQPHTVRPHRSVRVAVRRREGTAGHRRTTGGRGAGGQGGHRSSRHRRCARVHRRRPADQDGRGVRRRRR